MTITNYVAELTGRILDGKYFVKHLLGRGGMGAVYAAEHVGTTRAVAVKVIVPELVESPSALERFRREARAAGRLRHPNIVDVTDFGVAETAGGRVAYLVMEYLQGSTLRDLLERQHVLPVATVVGIVEQVAHALEAAHAAGLIHRDLKPENIWLTPDPRGGHIVRVIDFGLARIRDESQPMIDASLSRTEDRGPRTEDETRTMVMSGAAVSPSPSGQLTVAGTTLGTPAYMSPEQCHGLTADHRSDIYSLGVIAYEALAGRRPFSGSFAELIRQHCQDKPERLDSVGAASRRIADAVARSLEKSPEDRYQSAQAFAGSLYAAAEAPTVIIRRAVSVVSEHPGLFFRISLRAFALTLPLLLLALAFAPLFPIRHVGLFLEIAGLVAWMIMTMVTNTAAVVAIDRLRMRPMDVLEASEVFGGLREHLGLDRRANLLMALARLSVLYFAAELRARAFMGDLGFMVRFLEHKPAREMRERVDVLRRGVESSYGWIRGLIIASTLIAPFIEGSVVFALASAMTLPHAGDIAMIAAAVCIPLNTIVAAPVFAVALALLYFRARQAAGEDVPLAAVVMTAL